MGNQNALQSLIDGSRTGERKQEILTPPEILEPLRDMWGARPAFDPFGSEQHQIADATAHLPDDGQRYAWPDRTYGNPPYAALERALVGTERGRRTAAYYFAHEAAAQQGLRWAFLVPVRSHRKWWRRAANLQHVEVLELDPIKFVGYAQTFPAPLCLMFTGQSRAEIMLHFGHLGDLR